MTAPDDINARDERGQTKIYLAAEAGDAAEVARLLELKAEADFVDLPTTDWSKYLSLLTISKFINFFYSFDADARRFILSARKAIHQLFVCCSKPARRPKQKTVSGSFACLT